MSFNISTYAMCDTMYKAKRSRAGLILTLALHEFLRNLKVGKRLQTCYVIGREGVFIVVINISR